MLLLLWRSSMSSVDPWLLGDGLRLCYLRSSVSMHGESDDSNGGDLLSRAQPHLVTAPPTLCADEVFGRMPLISIRHDADRVVVGVVDVNNDNESDEPSGSLDVDIRSRVKAQIAASFEHRREISNDVVSLARQFTVDDWRDVFLQLRSFAVPHLLRLCQLCADSEALFDAVLTHVLPIVANSCVLDSAADDDDSDDAPPLMLPNDVSLLLDSVARHSSLHRVPLVRLNTHALLEPLNLPANNNMRQLFRQRILQCSTAALVSGSRTL
jgi:hypothetical protein